MLTDSKQHTDEALLLSWMEPFFLMLSLLRFMLALLTFRSWPVSAHNFGFMISDNMTREWHIIWTACYSAYMNSDTSNLSASTWLLKQPKLWSVPLFSSKFCLCEFRCINSIHHYLAETTKTFICAPPQKKNSSKLYYCNSLLPSCLL